jgi:hypothetical protein
MGLLGRMYVPRKARLQADDKHGLGVAFAAYFHCMGTGGSSEAGVERWVAAVDDKNGN